MTRELRYRQHSLAVTNWIESTLNDDLSGDLSSAVTVEITVREFGRLLNRLLDRIEISIGEATLAAVLDRVLYISTEKFPLLAILSTQSNRIKANDPKVMHLNPSEVQNAFHLLTTELLSTIGTLTAEIVTPQLYDVLRVEKDDQ